MSKINLEQLQTLISDDVKVSIYDSTWTDQSPFRSEKINKIEPCPNDTHIRIYFNDLHFFAIPYTAEITKTAGQWSAYDENSRLHYVIKT